MGWRNLSKTAEKSSSSPRAAGVPGGKPTLDNTCCVWAGGTFLRQRKKSSTSPCAASVLGDGHEMCRCVSFLVAAGNSCWCYFQTYNRDLEGRDHRQMTLLNLNSNVQNLCFFVFQRDRRMDWRTEKYTRCTWAGGTFLRQQKKSSSSPRAGSVLSDGHVMCHCVSFLVATGNSFLCYLRTYNRDLEGRYNRQMTFLNFNSYVQNLCFFVFQTDRWMDWWMEKLIRCGLGNLSVPPG
jgi:hypothetical protein